MIIYHLTGITHREERKGRESFGVEEVRDNSQRYSVARKYKLNPAATAIEIWNHIVSIYHSYPSSTRPRTSHALPPARCVRDLVEDIQVDDIVGGEKES